MKKHFTKKNIVLVFTIFLLLSLFAYLLDKNFSKKEENLRETKDEKKSEEKKTKSVLSFQKLFEEKEAQGKQKAQEESQKQISEESLSLGKTNDWKKEITLTLSEDVPEDFALKHNLPPHPGEAGDELVLGVDSNANGVMDDLERVIEYNFRNEPELRAIYLAGEVISYEELKNSLAENFSDEALRKIIEDTRNYVACETYYTDRIGKKSYMSELSTLQVYPNKKRKELSDIIESKANQYEVSTSLNDILAGREDGRFFPKANKVYCKDFVSKFGFSF